MITGRLVYDVLAIFEGVMVDEWFIENRPKKVFFYDFKY